MDTPFSKPFTYGSDNPTLNYNGGVAKQYDVSKWLRCQALWRNILYVALRT